MVNNDTPTAHKHLRLATASLENYYEAMERLFIW